VVALQAYTIPLQFANYALIEGRVLQYNGKNYVPTEKELKNMIL